MASQVLNGLSNPTYKNNTGQNARVIINFMYSDANEEITINWSGASITESGVEAIGKHIACASAWYGDFFLVPWSYWGWWWRSNRRLPNGVAGNYGSNPRTAISTQNVAIKLPEREVDIKLRRRGWWWWGRESSQDYSGFSISVALPLEIFLAPNESFSAICGAYNIVVIPEEG